MIFPKTLKFLKIRKGGIAMEKEKQEVFLKELEELLNEIKNEQIKMGKNIEQYHKVYMHNFAKLREFNKICDMTNQVFERRMVK